jgi:hypothetical protein
MMRLRVHELLLNHSIAGESSSYVEAGIFGWIFVLIIVFVGVFFGLQFYRRWREGQTGAVPSPNYGYNARPYVAGQPPPAPAQAPTQAPPSFYSNAQNNRNTYESRSSEVGYPRI